MPTGIMNDVNAQLAKRGKLAKHHVLKENQSYRRIVSAEESESEFLYSYDFLESALYSETGERNIQIQKNSSTASNNN